MTSLKLDLPIAPSLNNAYSQSRNGRRFLTEEGRSFKNQAGLLVRSSAARSGLDIVPGLFLKARVAIAMRFFFPDRRSYARRDIDNCYKLAGDAIAEALGYNDSCVDRIVLERAGIDQDRPRCEVEISIKVTQ